MEQILALFDEFDRDGNARRLEMQTDRNRVGELFRVAADRRGAFVQPALYEAFGLTAIEAMISGCPTFATPYVGPSKIMEYGVSGFHFAPVVGNVSSARMVEFLRATVR